MNVHLTLMEKQIENHSQVADGALQLTGLANETLKTATKEFSETVSILRSVHRKEIEQHRRTIRIMTVALIALTGCCIYLGSRIFINKC